MEARMETIWLPLDGPAIPALPDANEQAASEQLRRLQAIAEAALDHLARENLLHEMLHRIHHALSVEVVTILLVDAVSDTLVPRAALGLEADVVHELRLPLAQWFSEQVAAERQPLVIPDLDQLDTVHAWVRAQSIRSLLAVPLVVEGQTAGVIGVGTRTPRHFTADDVRLLQFAAGEIGLAIVHVQRYAAEQAARKAAERSAERATRLQAIAAALAEARSPERAATVIVDQAMVATGARAGAMAWLANRGSAVELIHQVGYPPELAAAWKRLSTTALVPLAEAVRTGELVLLESPEVWSKRYPQLAAPAGGGAGALAAIPLLSAGRAVGALELRFPVARVFDADDRAYMLALARQTAQAFEHARLYAAEQKARVAAENAQRHLDLLNMVGNLFATSLDDEPPFGQIARLAVPTLADWCTIHLRAADGTIRLAALAHRDPAQQEFLHELERQYPPGASRPTRLLKVLDTGEPELIPEVPEVLVEVAAADAAHLRRIRALNPQSVLIVPLRARGQTLGALSCCATQPGRYSKTDLALVSDLAYRCALALDNRRLYQAAQAAARQQREQAVRAQALAAVSQALAELRLDLPAILEAIVQLVAEQIGDICVLRLISDDGLWLIPVAHYHSKAGARELVQELYAAPHRVGEGTSGRVAQTGVPILISVVPQEHIREAIKPEYWPYLERYGIHSLLIVPLRLRERVIGVLGMSRDAPGQPYTPDDQVFLQSLADHAALAIDNARLYHQAQAAVGARDELLSLVSHDLANPLTAIRGNASLARDRLEQSAISSPYLAERLAQIEAASQQMEHMIDELRDGTRMQAGQPLELDRGSVDLVALARQIVAEHQQVAPQHRIQVRAHVPALFGDWDAARLGRVLANLLANAIKYSPQGGPITVDLKREEMEAGAFAVLAVRDQGLGIPAEDLPRIFEPFQRARNVVGRIGGSGLGLASVRQIVEQHGGTIAVTSEGGAGSTFTVRLPLKEQ
jgi:signal transduction histidine kinase